MNEKPLFADLPPAVRQEFTSHMGSAWGRTSTTGRAATREEAERLIHESMGYTLRMYWQGRTDKYSSYVAPVLEWITRIGVPEPVLRRDEETNPVPKGHARHGHLRFPDDSHTVLADAAVRAAIEVYAALPDTDLPSPANTPRPGLLSRLLGR